MRLGVVARALIEMLADPSMMIKARPGSGSPDIRPHHRAQPR
jgi:hypothetical protein